MKRSMARLALAGLAAMVVVAAGGCAPTSDDAQQKTGMPVSAQQELNRRMGGVTGPQNVGGAPGTPGAAGAPGTLPPMRGPGGAPAPMGPR